MPPGTLSPNSLFLESWVGHRSCSLTYPLALLAFTCHCWWSTMGLQSKRQRARIYLIFSVPWGRLMLKPWIQHRNLLMPFSDACRSAAFVVGYLMQKVGDWARCRKMRLGGLSVGWSADWVAWVGGWVVWLVRGVKYRCSKTWWLFWGFAAFGSQEMDQLELTNFQPLNFKVVEHGISNTRGLGLNLDMWGFWTQSSEGNRTEIYSGKWPDMVWLQACQVCQIWFCLASKCLLVPTTVCLSPVDILHVVQRSVTGMLWHVHADIHVHIIWYSKHTHAYLCIGRCSIRYTWTQNTWYMVSAYVLEGATIA